MMRQEVADELARLVATYGRALGEDPRRCQALLRDLCPTDRAEVAVLAAAAEEDVPRQLVSSSAPIEVTLPRLTEGLRAARGLAPDAAAWAVASWAVALGVDVPATSTGADVPATSTGGGRGGTGTASRTPARASAWDRPRILVAGVVAPPVLLAVVANLVYGWDLLSTVLLIGLVLPTLPYLRLVTGRPLWAAVLAGLSCLAILGFAGYVGLLTIETPLNGLLFAGFTIVCLLAPGVAAGRLATLAWAKR